MSTSAALPFSDHPTPQQPTGPDSRPARPVRSARRRRRLFSVIVASVLVLALVVAIAFFGTRVPTVGQFWRVLTGERVPGLSFQILEDRLPRAAVGLLAGAALGFSGSLFQTLLRNPLASPDVIGITGAASAAAITGKLVWGTQGWSMTLLAFVGAVGVAVVLFLLSGSGRRTGGRLIVSGIAIAAATGALVDHLLSRTDIRLASDALLWLTGSLSASSWERVTVLGLALLVLLPLGAVGARSLRLLELGDDLASALGTNVQRNRLFVLVVASGLAAAATSITGPIVFVAFLGGLTGRALAGGRPSPTLSALSGAVLVLAAELLGSLGFGDIRMPAGVITGILGAPVLLVLLTRAGSSR